MSTPDASPPQEAEQATCPGACVGFAEPCRGGGSNRRDGSSAGFISLGSQRA